MRGRPRARWRNKLAYAGVASSILAGLCAASVSLALPSCAASSPSAPGEVVVVVTTDMEVPADLDNLQYSVTVVGDEAPTSQGTFALSDPSVLPATLAVVSAGMTDRQVDIRLDGLHSGAVRVHREARLALPARGVKSLAMPLDWLCSDVNRSQDGGAPSGLQAPSCDPGQTCSAGDCTDAGVADPSQLPDYVAVDAGCFQTLNCFTQTLFVGTPLPDPTTGQCILSPGESGHGLGANYALVVDTSQGGNYGACVVADGLCLIPLDRGGPGGWEPLASDGGAPDIGLPASVCRDVGHTLLGVAVTPSCDLKTPGSPSCTAPGACVRAAECPPDWNAWIGYTCAPTAVLNNSQLVGCFAPGATADASGPPPPGSRCCTTGEPPSSDPLLIDDMSGGPEVKITPPPGKLGGYWFTASDDRTSPIYPQPSTLFRYTSIPGPATPDGGTINAACVEGPGGFDGYYVIEGFNFVVNAGSFEPAGAPFDVSAYSGIRFWAYSDFDYQDLWVSFTDDDTSTVYPRSACLSQVDAGGCAGDDFGQDLTLTRTWTEYSLRWSDLAQRGFGAQFPALDRQHVFTTDFEILGVDPMTPYPPFRICVADIRFTQDADAGANDQ